LIILFVLHLLQLLTEANMKGKIVDLEAHFCNEVLKCASRLQMDGNGTTETSQLDTSLSLKFTPEKFGEEFLTCIKDLPAAQVT